MAIDLSGVYYELDNLTCDCEGGSGSAMIDDEVGSLLFRVRSGLYNSKIDGTLEEILERLERILS